MRLFLGTKISRIIATGFFAGSIPVAPGTWGSLEALVWVALLYRWGPVFQAACVLVTFLLGVWSAQAVACDSGHPDPPSVVIDEICGIFVTFLFLPITPGSLVLGFIVFRIFDIFKLPWIRRLEALSGGYGVMADDVAAGVISNLVLRLVLLWRP